MIKKCDDHGRNKVQEMRRDFQKPRWGLKPLEYKAGMKMPGGLVGLGAIIVCPKCGFEGPVKEYDSL